MNDVSSPRQKQPSSAIDIDRLERESRKFIYIGLVIGVVIHLVAGQFIAYTGIRLMQSAGPLIRQIPAELVVLPPDMQNPYEHWRREPVSRQYKKQDAQLVRQDERVDWRGNLSDPNTPQSTVMPDGTVPRMLREQADRGDSLIADMHAQEAADRYRIDLRLGREPGGLSFFGGDLLNLDDIDALGTYKALVIRDPSDRQNLRGFFHIPQYCIDIGSGYNLERAPTGLSEAFNYYTGLKLLIDDPMMLSALDFHEYPVVYLATASMEAFEMSELQTRNVREYIDNGGFVILDNGRPWSPWTPAAASLLDILIKTFGDTIQLRKLSHNHPVFYCFFEFHSLPPEGAEKWPKPIESGYPDWGRLLHDPVLDRLRRQVTASPASLWGVWQGERLVAIYSDKGYGHLWCRGIIANQSRDFYANSGEKYNFNPQLKLGVNILVYALLQEGGIARRLTDYSLK